MTVFESQTILCTGKTADHVCPIRFHEILVPASVICKLPWVGSALEATDAGTPADFLIPDLLYGITSVRYCAFTMRHNEFLHSVDAWRPSPVLSTTVIAGNGGEKVINTANSGKLHKPGFAIHTLVRIPEAVMSFLGRYR